MTTIPLTPAMYAMLARAGARPDGSIETRKQTADALRVRGLAVVTLLSSGRVGVTLTALGRHRLKEAEAEEAAAPRPLVTWTSGRYGTLTGTVGTVDVFSIARSTSTSNPGFYLDSRLFVTSRELHRDETAAKDTAEVNFRAWIAELGLQPIPGGA